MIRFRVLAILLGMLVYMSALVRPFEKLLPDQRKYVAVRSR